MDICSEVSVNSPGNRGVSPEEEKEGYGGKDLQKRNVLCLVWKSEGWWAMSSETVHEKIEPIGEVPQNLHANN